MVGLALLSLFSQSPPQTHYHQTILALDHPYVVAAAAQYYNQQHFNF